MNEARDFQADRDAIRQEARDILEEIGDAWLPIGTAPAGGSPILLWNGVEVAEGFYYKEPGDGYVLVNGQIKAPVKRWVAVSYYMRTGRYPPATHWRPMPGPPRPRRVLEPQRL